MNIENTTPRKLNLNHDHTSDEEEVQNLQKN